MSHHCGQFVLESWLDTVQNSLDTDTAQDDAVSWAAFHAELDKHVTREIPITALLPLFRYNANTAAMIRHTLLVTQKAVHFLNAKQIPVVYFDQPLYALAKQVQWHWPEMFGEDQFVIMMGGLPVSGGAGHTCLILSAKMLILSVNSRRMWIHFGQLCISVVSCHRGYMRFTSSVVKHIYLRITSTILGLSSSERGRH